MFHFPIEFVLNSLQTKKSLELVFRSQFLWGGGDFFLMEGGFAQGIFFQSLEAFVMLKLIFHIYQTSVNEN